MRVLVDMNLSPRWVELLKAAGFEAAHWSALGPMNAPDEVIMAHAQRHGWVVLTHDLDFGTMLASAQHHQPSVVQVRCDDVSPDAIGSAVLAALRQMQTDLEAGALITIDPKRARLRLLPLLPR